MDKIKAFLPYLLTLVIGAALGAYLVPRKVETKTIEVAAKQTDTERNKHKETQVTERTLPDGTKEVVTNTKEDTVTQKSSSEVSRSEVESKRETGSSSTSISLLGGTHIKAGDGVDFGLSLDRSLIGPLTIGVFGFQSGLVGASVGVRF